MENKISDGSDKSPDDKPYDSEYNRGQKITALVELVCYSDFSVSSDAEAIGVVKAALSQNGQEFGNVTIATIEPYDPDEDSEDEEDA